jgi:hypothetical protein
LTHGGKSLGLPTFSLVAEANPEAAVGRIDMLLPSGEPLRIDIRWEGNDVAAAMSLRLVWIELLERAVEAVRVHGAKPRGDHLRLVWSRPDP